MDPMITALVILIITIILFIWEPIPIIVTAIGASIAYAYTGIIEVGDIFTGYNSDTIVLLGKGHEDYQILKDRTIHFDEREVVAQIAAELKK